MANKATTAVFCTYEPNIKERVFIRGRFDRLQSIAPLHPVIVSPDNFDKEAPNLSEVEAVFSTWGMWNPTEEQFAQLPKLKAVFYAAGATDGFARTFLSRGIAVHSAWKANAIPVAEFVFSQIILGLKGFFRNVLDLKTGGRSRWGGENSSWTGEGAYHETVALLGNGEISRVVQKFLELTDVDVILIPSRPQNRTMSFEEAFKVATVVSNHLPDRTDNKKCITKEMLASMKEGAVFINTGRGAQIDERGMIEVAIARPDLTFLLDVTSPEPPVEGDPLYTLPNVQLTRHIAGSINGECARMADFMMDDYLRWKKGEPTLYQVTESMLLTS